MKFPFLTHSACFYKKVIGVIYHTLSRLTSPKTPINQKSVNFLLFTRMRACARWGGGCKTVMRGRHLFEKRLSSPHPIFQKLSDGIAFIVTDKNNSNFMSEVSKKKKLRLFRRSPFDCKELTQSSRSKSMSETKIFPVAFWMPNCRLAATTSPGTLNSASNSFQSKEPERELRIAFPS